MPFDLTSTRTNTGQQASLNGLDGYPHRWFGRFPDKPASDGADEQPDTYAEHYLT